MYIYIYIYIYILYICIIYIYVIVENFCREKLCSGKVSIEESDEFFKKMLGF